jgi:hypothetical protein
VDDAGLPQEADGGPVCMPETALQTCIRTQACGVRDVQDNCGASIRVTCLCTPSGQECPDAIPNLPPNTWGFEVCDGMCVDTASDPNNCLGCGISCGDGGACVRGFCQ